MSKENPNVYIVAGPNGSGKTTFAKEFLPLYAHGPQFVNADLIALGLSPFNPSTVAIQAGRLVLDQIDQLVKRREDFAFETTLSGRSYLRLFKQLKSRGYRLHLFFLWIPSTGLAIGRIKCRVQTGGHHVPSEDVKRRFKRSARNFFLFYEPLVDSWIVFDNSRFQPEIIARRDNGHQVIVDSCLFKKIVEAG